MASSALDYMTTLVNNVYSQYGVKKINPYPNVLLPHHVGKSVTQYTFFTTSLPLFSAIHALWYRWDREQQLFIKIIPECIELMFGPIALAH